MKLQKPVKVRLNSQTDMAAIDHAALLDFADVMENLWKLKELDIVPKSFVDYIKEDSSKITTLMEYNEALMAVMDGSLLIYIESIEKFYKICQKALMNVKDHIFACIPQNWRDSLTSYRNSKEDILNKISEAAATGVFGIDDKESQKILYSADLSSKTLMCYNGEYGQSFTIRCDLIILGQVKDFEKELAVLAIVHKRFKKSSIAWHYRKVVFMCYLSQVIMTVKKQIQSNGKPKVTAEDFARLKDLWEKELDRLDPIIHKHGRSYKIWEYLLHMATYLFENLELLKEFAKYLPQNQINSFSNELEILVVQGFIGWYERVKEHVKKNVHNHCTFGLLINIIKILLKLKMDIFMDSPNFYKTFLEEHENWLDELRSYYRLIYGKSGQSPSLQEKGRVFTMESERIKLESLEEHSTEIKHLLKNFVSPK